MNKILVFILLMAVVFSHKFDEDEDIDELFQTLPEEEELLKARRMHNVKVAGEDAPEEIIKPKTEIKYFDDTPRFDNAVEKYMYYLNKYKVEIMLLFSALIFLFNLFLGKSKNRSLAEAFHVRTLEVIKKNFAHQGLGEVANPNLH